MLFNSYTFIIFFVAVLVLSRLISNWTLRKGMLLIVSYLFYAAWNPPFVLLLWFSTIIDWFAGRKLHQSRTLVRRRLFLTMSLVSNLGMLAYFKYGGFFLQNLNSLMSSLNLDVSFGQSNIILPVGISFYTFQTLSYTIDIYKGKLKPWHSFLDYALYVTFFPQLVAGPIVRASEFLPQCVAPRIGNRSQIGWGMSLFVVGVFAKVVIADVLMAPYVEIIYDANLPAGFLSAWAGTLAFAVQIFCDFFGYSTCAIGIALCLGFSLPDNFRYPYAAIGFSDFWNRWHISLSSWLRDYLYIPLGGNRKGPVRVYINLSITMLLGGLWHGPSWMFVIWGGLHGTYLIAERMLATTRLGALEFWKTGPGRMVLTLFTFGLVCITWVFFRARSLDQALSLSAYMTGFSGLGKAMISFTDMAVPAAPVAGVLLAKFDYFVIFGCTIALLAVHQYLRNSNLEEFFAKMPIALRSLILGAMMYVTIISMTGEDRAFIYFQF